MASASVQVAETVPAFTGQAAPPAATPVPANDRYCVKSKRQREIERKRRAKVAAHIDAARQAPASAPYSASGFTASELAVLEVKVATRDNMLMPKEEREAAGKAIFAMEAIRDARMEARWSDAANDETATLAEARGETVERKKGRVRIVSRCGLSQALHAGYLRPNHGAMSEADTWEAARKYRDAFEVTNGCTTPSANDQGGGGAVRAPEVRPIMAGQLLAVMRRGLTVQAITVLDAVCGRALSIDVAAGLVHRRFRATHELLTQAITQVVLNLAEERRLAKAGASELYTAEEIEAACNAYLKAARSV